MLPTNSTVVTPAQDQRLITLPQVKLEFDIRVDDQNRYLEEKIDTVSDEIAGYCNRIFGAQTYEDTFDTFSHYYQNPNSRRLLLRNWPVVAGSVAVTCDGVAVTSLTDLQIFCETGTISNKLYWFIWPGRWVVVTYQAGWRLPGWPEGSGAVPLLPKAIQQAALLMVLSTRQAGRISYTDRDPFLRSETVEGAGSLTYSADPIGGAGGSLGGMSPAVMDKLAPYKTDNRAR